MPRLFFAFALVLSASACTGADPRLLCQGSGGPCAAVGTTSDDGTTGSLATVDLHATTTKLDVASLDPDTRMHVHGGELYVLAGNTGTLRIYDPSTMSVKVELPLRDSTHPATTALARDFWVDDEHGKIWVSLSGNDANASLAIVDRNQPGMVLYLGLPQDPADSDGKPEPDRLYSCNSKLYVTLKSSSTDVTGALRYGQARIAIIDPDTRTAGGIIFLSGQNISDLTRVGDDCNDVVVAEAGSPTTALDGSGTVERLDLSRGFSKGVLATDTVLGGRPTLVATHGSHDLYIAVDDRIAHLNLKTASLVADVASGLGPMTFFRTYGDRLLVGARAGGTQPRGLYSAPTDGSMLTTPSIDVGMTPTSITLP